VIVAQISDIHLNINATQLGKLKLGANGDNLTYVNKRKILKYCVDQAIEHKAEQVFLSGDIFDKNKPFPQEYVDLNEILKPIKDKVKLLYGNHDEMTSKGCGLHPLVAMGYDVALELTTWDKFFYLCPWGKLDYSQIEEGSVLVLHAGVKTSDHDWVEVEGEQGNVHLADLQALGCRGIMLGHHHAQVELAPKIWYAGSVSCETFGEENDKKGMLIWDITRDSTVVKPISTHHLFPVYKTFTPEEFSNESSCVGALIRVKGEVSEAERLSIIKKLKDFDCLDFKLDLTIKRKHQKVTKLSGVNDRDTLKNYLVGKGCENIDEILAVDKELNNADI
jgi:DNA repair exonuclease SbcCD nuclease subunit